MSLVEKIQKLCRNDKISLSKLEQTLGFGNGSIYKWDTNSPSANKVIKVAQYFKVTTDYLLLEDTEESQAFLLSE